MIFENDDFLFNVPSYAKVEIDKKTHFLNINFPEFSGKLHTTFVELDNNLLDHIEQSRSLAYKHNNHADIISEQVYIDQKNNVYGCFMIMKG